MATTTMFDLETLKALRKQKKVTIKELAGRLEMSSTQLHRLENGSRRLSVETLLNYCDALAVQPAELFATTVGVPVTATVTDDEDIVPLPPTEAGTVNVPRIVPDMQNIAALRWGGQGRLGRMEGHIVLYYRHHQGIPDQAWNNRCLLMFKTGRQKIGWPVKDGETVHVDSVDGNAEFNVDLQWASPILCVLPPFLLTLQTEPALFPRG